MELAAVSQSALDVPALRSSRVTEPVREIGDEVVLGHAVEKLRGRGEGRAGVLVSGRLGGSKRTCAFDAEGRAGWPARTMSQIFGGFNPREHVLHVDVPCRRSRRRRSHGAPDDSRSAHRGMIYPVDVTNAKLRGPPANRSCCVPRRGRAPAHADVRLGLPRLVEDDAGRPQMSDVRLTDAEAHDDSDGASPAPATSRLSPHPRARPARTRPSQPSSPPIPHPSTSRRRASRVSPPSRRWSPLVREWLGLSRAEGSRAARCLGGCAIINLVLLALLVIVSVAVTAPNPAPFRRRHIPVLRRPGHVSTSLGAVAADEPRCGDRRGGVRRRPRSGAAGPAALCLGVLHPRSSGIGGGAFAVVRPRTARPRRSNSARRRPPRRPEHVRGLSRRVARGRPRRRGALGDSRFTPGVERHGTPRGRVSCVPRRRSRRVSPWVPNSRAPSRNAERSLVTRRRRRRFRRTVAPPSGVGDTCANPALARTLRAIATGVPTRFERVSAEALRARRRGWRCDDGG